jgi:hypothetical protein
VNDGWLSSLKMTFFLALIECMLYTETAHWPLAHRLCRSVHTLEALLDDAVHLPAELKESALEVEAAVLSCMAAGSQDVTVQRWCAAWTSAAEQA